MIYDQTAEGNNKDHISFTQVIYGNCMCLLGIRFSNTQTLQSKITHDWLHSLE